MALAKQSDLTMRASRRVGALLCGKYKLDRLLGTGGMAAVYAATNTAGERVAVKYLHEQLLHDEEAVARFRREAYVANQIDHPRALRVLDDDVDREGGGTFLVMELLEGETVRARWERLGKKVALGEAAAIGIATLDVLAAAHARGIVHRDIKPENLFLTMDAKLYVLDFGIARLLQGTDEASATQSGTTIGTPFFMAPEQAIGRSRDVDARTDIWAVGATLFALLSGRYVHPAETAGEAIAYAAMRPAPSLAGVVADVPDAVAAVVDRALAFKREDRWPNSQSMQAALRETVPRPELPAGVPRVALGLRDVAPLDDEATAVPHRASARPASRGGAAASVAPTGKTIAPDAQSPRRGRLRFALASVAALAALILAPIGYMRVRDAGRTVDATAPSSSGTPVSAKPEAAALYRAGAQLLHDAQWDAATNNFEEATRIDPSLAPAHLRVVAASEEITESARKHYARAVELRVLLSVDERELLDALAPALDTPPTWTAAADRLKERATRLENDPEAWFLAAKVAEKIGRYSEAIELAQHTLDRDASFASAFLIIGRARWWQDRVEDARVALARCIEINAAATKCLDELNDLDASEGRCQEAEDVSRRLIALEPANAGWYQNLARATFARTRSVEATRSVFDAVLERTDAEERVALAHRYAFGLAAVAGRFDDAARELEDWEAGEAAEPSELAHAERARLMIDLRLELGDKAAAVTAARRFLDRRSVWIASRGYDFEILGWEGLYRAGAIGRAELQQRRDAWFQRVRSLSSQPWQMAYLQSVVTEDDAHDAIERAPTVPVYLREVRSQDGYGEALRMVGRHDDASVQLTRAARNCRAVLNPIEATQASVHLGELLHARGDTAGACAAFAVVRERWAADRRSVSARAAEARVRELRCSR